MLQSVFEGRETVKQTYDNILIYLKSILSTELNDDLNVDLSILEDLLIEESNNEPFTVFKLNLFTILDKYLLGFGVLLKEEKSFEIYFKIFYLLYNIKQLDYYKEEVEIIIYGDYNDEDKIHLLFSLYFEETIEVLDTIDVSSLFFTFIEGNIKQEKIYNMDLILRAVTLSKYDDSFKFTILFKQIMNAEVIYNITIKNDLDIIRNELTERVYNNILNKYEYKEELNKVTNEIIFTLLFYHYDVVMDLTKVFDNDFILRLFNKPVLEIDGVIDNINNTIRRLLKDNNE